MAVDTKLNDKNVSLKDFVDRHATPFNLSNDDYECSAFDVSVKAGKNTPIYGLHPYHTKVPPEGIEHYIKHYTKKGDLILDPFCGSGMTGVAGSKLKRSVILNDLSPAACHIAYNYCTPIDTKALKIEFERIKEAVVEEINWLYGTICECGKKATIQYTIWSDVFACTCGTELILWEVGVDSNTGEVKEAFQCPNTQCERLWTKAELKRLRSVPVITNYHCPECGRKSHPTTLNEKALIKEIDDGEISSWYPTTPFDESREMWRAVHRSHGITDVSKFYSKRNLRACARLWSEFNTVSSERIKRALRFSLTAITNYINKRQSWGGGGGGISGTLYIGSLVLEKNVLDVWSRKMKKQIKAFAGRSFESFAQVLINCGSATDMNEIPSCSADYIFTDPPFGSNLFYADLNLLWESWLEQITDESFEAVVHVKHKNKNTLPDYKRLMAESFAEMHRILKPNRWATVVFSNSDDKVWAAIQEAAQEVGFVIYGGKEFDKIQRSFKGTKGAKGKEKVATKDVILNLHKPRVPLVQGADLKKVDDVDGFVLKELRETLLHMSLDAPLQERTSEALARAVTRRALENGYSMKGLSFNYVEDVLISNKHEFVNIDGGWFFTAAKPDLQRVVDERSVIVWLTTLLSKEPQRFDEINPLWQQEISKTKYRSPDGLKSLLDTWFLCQDGRYYPPDEYERKQIKGLVDEERYRDAERFRSGKLDREPSVEEIFQWIEIYYTKQEWEKVAELAKPLVVHLDWEQVGGGKNAQIRIQLAMSKLSAKKQVTSIDQQELF